MKITLDFAKKFAHGWIEAWNSHELNKIIDHYSDHVNYSSPFIELMKINETGYLDNINDVKNYFAKALNQYPDLNFVLHEVLSGANTLIIYYTSVNNKKCAECMEFNDEGKIISVKIHYNYFEFILPPLLLCFH